MSSPGDLFVRNLTESLDRLVEEPFDPDNPRHAALFELLDDDCPECRHRVRKVQTTARPTRLD